MLRYAEDLSDGDVLKTDICIIGSGAAGIAMADRFRLAGKEVIVLESSRVNEPPRMLAASAESLKRLSTLPTNQNPHRYEDPAVQPIYEADVSDDMRDKAHDPDFATRSRIRVYGGTTNCWGGWTRPLAREDFFPTKLRAERWPFQRDELRAGYEAALQYCSLPSVDIDNYDDAAWWEGKTNPKIEAIPSSADLTSVAFTVIGGNGQQDGKWDFQKRWGPKLESEETKNVTIYRNANVRKLTLTNSRITSVSAQTIDRDGDDPQPGKVTFTVEANRYILAAGGIETVRLLLLSGLDRRDLLGCYFMVHPVIWNAGRFSPGSMSPTPEVRAYYTGQPQLTIDTTAPPPAQIFATMTPTSKTLADNELGNFRAIINFDYSTIGMNWEQQPNVNSRIRLDPAKKDLFDDPHIRVDWLLPQVDLDSAAIGVKLVAKELYQLGYAASSDIRPITYDIDTPGDHHMGATRMHIDPEKGYVDADCKVHHTHNLYIASSSVFPTGGYANPTLTIIALAVRLADHLIAT